MSEAAPSQRDRAPRLGGLYARAAIALAPGAHRLPGVPGGGGAMPALSLALEDVRVEPRALDAYRAVCCIPAGEELPIAYPHVLAFPLQMALMTDPRFPFGPVGLVHVENRIRWSAPIAAEEPLALRVRAGQLRAHPKGLVFTITTEARAGGALWWEESTMLRRGTSPAGAGAQAASGAQGASGAQAASSAQGASGAQAASGAHSGSGCEQRVEGLQEVTHWQLPEFLGRRYAAVAGDRNPIHMHPLAAKLFGFRRAIAHGMWTMARSLAQVGATPTAPGEVQVAFRRPIELPAEVSFHEGADAAGGARFEVRSAGGRSILHLTGSATRLSESPGGLPASAERPSERRREA